MIVKFIFFVIFYIIPSFTTKSKGFGKSLYVFEIVLGDCIHCKKFMGVCSFVPRLNSVYRPRRRRFFMFLTP